MFVENANLFFNGSSYQALYDITNSELKDVKAWLSFFFLIAIFILHSPESDVSLCFGR